jgi:CAAX protease family protein
VKRDWLALVVAMVYPTAMAWVYFFAVPAAEHPGDSHPIVIAYSAGKVVQFAFPLLWSVVVERRRLQPRPPSLAAVSLGTGIGLAIGIVVLAGYSALAKRSSLFAGSAERVRGRVLEFGLDGPVRYVLFCLFLAVLHSLLEEYYWRWFVFGRLKERLRVTWANLLSSIAFASHHVVVLSVFFPGRFWQMTAPLSAGVALGGMLFAWLYQRSDSLYAAWVCHLLIDAAILTVGYAMAFPESHT